MLLPTVRIVIACGLLASLAASADAAPRNPYSSFNLSGINYGAQQWERAQRQGRRVWPYYNTPSRSYGGGRNSGLSIGGVVGGGGGAGTIIQGGVSRPAPRSSPRVYRRWRR